MLKNTKLIVLLLFILTQCKSQKSASTYKSETLKIEQLSARSFIHISYLNTDEYGKVACNGMVYINNNEAVVFDTPTKTQVSQELLNWLRDEQKATVKAVVINHFHIDCLGGLKAFHDAEIPSYANTKTMELAEKSGAIVPQIGFEQQNELVIGNEKVVNTFFGEAHTPDNIIHYIQSEALIYGGCMIKSLKASKGNLEDANIAEWSKTVQNIKNTYPKLKTVVPGHGPPGNTDLLDYTIELFKPN